MTEIEEIKSRVTKIESEQRAIVNSLGEIQHSIKNLELYIMGNKEAGVKGIIGEMKGLRFDLGKDYADESNIQNERIARLNNMLIERCDWLDSRVKVLEEHDKTSARKHGFIAGISAAIGGIVGFLISIYK
jgi:hypothetical protein